ncbi:MAG: SRPBCC family protein [Nitrososphaerota archaeon]|nr:SRPBCC family protein [Nitrososphaerota archaeon]
MIEISKSQEVDASVDSVWKIISDAEEESKYWKVLKNVKILSRKGNAVEREATIKRGPMGEAKSVQTLVLDRDARSTILTLKKGPMLGTRKITLSSIGSDKSRIDVSWKFELKGIPSFAQGFAKDNISEVTEKALTRIAEKAVS